MRRSLRCALPGFPEQDWDSKPIRGEYMGRLPIIKPDKGEAGSASRPPESHEDGCPGAWYRCAFVQSIRKYERLLTDGGFSENIMLSRTHDPLVIEAMQYLEMERLRAKGDDNERRFAD